jgi:hypothetical protein
VGAPCCRGGALAVPVLPRAERAHGPGRPLRSKPFGLAKARRDVLENTAQFYERASRRHHRNRSGQPGGQ